LVLKRVSLTVMTAILAGGETSLQKRAAILRRAKELGLPVPRLPDGEGIAEYRRDIVRYCVEVIWGQSM